MSVAKEKKVKLAQVKLDMMSVSKNTDEKDSTATKMKVNFVNKQ